MILNPDKDKVAEIRKALKENDNYCPCSIVQDETTKCPCLYFRNSNKCICDLYIEGEKT